MLLFSSFSNFQPTSCHQTDLKLVRPRTLSVCIAACQSASHLSMFLSVLLLQSECTNAVVRGRLSPVCSRMIARPLRPSSPLLLPSRRKHAQNPARPNRSRFLSVPAPPLNFSRRSPLEGQRLQQTAAAVCPRAGGGGMEGAPDAASAVPATAAKTLLKLETSVKGTELRRTRSE